MAKIISRARRLRVDLASRLERPVTVQEVADALGISRKRLTYIELGKFDEISTQELMAICTYYSTALGRSINTNDVLEYDLNSQRASVLLGLAA